MAEAVSHDSVSGGHWILVAEYFNQKVAEGLSPLAAEQAIRREGVQGQLHCRCHNEAGDLVDTPVNLWMAARFDFVTSWADTPLPPDPLIPILSRINREAEERDRAIRRMLGEASTDSPKPPQLSQASRYRKLFVEVFVEKVSRPAAPEATEAPVELATSTSAELRANEEPQIRSAAEAEIESPRSGAKPKYDWGAMQSECILRLHQDGVPDNRSKFGRELLEWYGKQFDVNVELMPDLTTLDRYLIRWIEAFKRSLPRD